MTIRQRFEKAQNDYENVMFVFTFDENGNEFYDVNEALEFAQKKHLHDVMWVNSRNNQIYGGLYFQKKAG